MPLLLLNGDLEFDDKVVDEDTFLAEVPEMIPTYIAGIHQFWKSRSRTSGVSRSQSRPEIRDKHVHGVLVYTEGNL
jgi:hypothetical protein